MRLGLGVWGGAAALLAGALAVAADRDPDAGRDAGGGGRRGDRMAAFLGLSDSQRGSWEAAHEEFAAAVRPLHDQIRTQHDEIEAMLEKGGVDAAEVGRRVIGVHGVHEKIEAAHDRLEEQLKGMLTPDQQVKFEAMRAVRGMGHKDHGAGSHGKGFHRRRSDDPDRPGLGRGPRPPRRPAPPDEEP